MGLKGIYSQLAIFSAIWILPLPAPGYAEDAPTAKIDQPEHSNGRAAPLKLYGRIEELSRRSGARLPLAMEALTPRRDASLDDKDLTGKLKASKSFPVDFIGNWSGELTVHSFSCDKTFFDFDPVEARKQRNLLQAGTRGNCSVIFFRGKDNETQMLPCAVAFASRTALAAGLPDQAQSYTSGQNDIPFVYYLHLGDLSSGKGLTGNDISCQLMKNTLKELAQGVMEQVVVTRDFNRNPASGKVKTGYSESVLRFTRLKNNQLYLQAASVSYDSKAKFQNKVILYGTLAHTGNQL